jgi:four helix bundle protein
MTNSKYDLEERTAKFAESIIGIMKKVSLNTVNKPIISQLIRSSTSVGANYCEADDAESRLDFKHKIGICKKEARETKHWLRMLATSNPEIKEMLKPLWQEAKELNLIFNAITNTTKRN